MISSSFRRSAAILALVLLVPALPRPVRAMDCGADPVYDRSLSAVVTTGARVRDTACMTGSTVLTTLPVGAQVTIIAETDGWYKVRTAAGTEGWVGQWLLKPGAVAAPVVPTPIPTVAPAPVPVPTTAPAPTPVPTQPPADAPIKASPFQFGTVPDQIDVLALNQYWLDRVNTLRAKKGLRLLVLDQRFVDTASEWSRVMAARDYASHMRADGKTMHQWIATKGLAFTKRYAAGGWRTNYFTENIAWGRTGNAMAEAEAALDLTLKKYLREGPAGAHYRTIYHPDWNSVGAGFAFAPSGNGFEFYQTFHYGSLVNPGAGK